MAMLIVGNYVQMVPNVLLRNIILCIGFFSRCARLRRKWKRWSYRKLRFWRWENTLTWYKASGLLSTDCKNRNLRDRFDYDFGYKLQNSEFSELGFLSCRPQTTNYNFQNCSALRAAICIKKSRRDVPVTRFSQMLPIFHENERFSKWETMRSHPKPVPFGKIDDFSRCFFSVLTISRIPGSRDPEFRILEFWNSRTPTMCPFEGRSGYA